MVSANIKQSTLNQGSDTSTQYINKFELAEDGTLTVTKTPIVASNLLNPLPTTTTKVSTTNQILAGTNVVTTPTKDSSTNIIVNADGKTVNPQPPGPPGYNPGT